MLVQSLIEILKCLPGVDEPLQPGALTTNEKPIAELARALRAHGQTGRYFHDSIGYNYRMEGFQGAVLRVKLKRLDEWTRKRRHFARLYRELLAGARVGLLQDDPNCECVYHLFPVYVDDRDAVGRKLAERGIETAIHYPLPVHLQRSYASLGYTRGGLPCAERACERVLCLPIFPEMDEQKVEYAANTLAEIAG